MSNHGGSSNMVQRLKTNTLTTIFRRGFKVRHKPRDSTPTFTLFLALPAEIRERIYEACCDNDREILEEHFISAKPPPEPAVACTSRQLRDEALPVFYRHYRFPVTFSSGALINNGYLPPSQEWRAARWHHRLDPAKLRMIRRLELHYCFGRFQVDFEARGNSYDVRQTAWGSRRLVDVHPTEEKQQLLALVRSLIDSLVESPGVGAFTAHDFDRLELEVVPEEERVKKVR
ncbi:hypothetical protein PRZ48_002129 [Zasmidium cellare]|uniref:2EXR domain-containing protein n=1 Tax=Zasmidium cellare TaxID=395010 RepID=A0ABR0F4Z0_ZASCE|nr:hypothetical protein PRZ48_002129 [Zasmidium cellare]